MDLRPLEPAPGAPAPLVGEVAYAGEPLVDRGAVDGASHFQLPDGASGASVVLGGWCRHSGYVWVQDGRGVTAYNERTLFSA